MGTPLPDVDSPQVRYIINEDPNCRKAYKLCLEYEREHAADQKKLRHIRVLGYLLLHAPYQGVRDEVTKCINSYPVETDLADVGALFERHVILTFLKYKDRTPRPNERPSRRSYMDSREETEDGITEASKDQCEAKHQALIRDNWRCVVTHVLDETAPGINDPMISTVATECAHIIPQSILFSVEPKTPENNKFQYSASTLAVLKQFRYDISAFDREKVHSLTNVMSLAPNVHDKFNRLKLYLEATSVENHYEVKFFNGPPPGYHQFVTFTTTDPENLPVPEPSLLALHATCCKVAHLSGAAEYIDKVYCDADRIGVLLADGSSEDTLDFVLSALSTSAHLESYTLPVRLVTPLLLA